MLVAISTYFSPENSSLIRHNSDFPENRPRNTLIHPQFMAYKPTVDEN